MTYLRPALVMLILLTLITGIAYPLLTTGLAQLLFPAAANGSLLYQGDKAVGSALIGQNFMRADYFWGRPSATGDSAYNPQASAGSNLAATNPALDKAIAERAAQLRQANPAMSGPIPVDLLTASGSGLDPQISIAAAQYQTGAGRGGASSAAGTGRQTDRRQYRSGHAQLHGGIGGQRAEAEPGAGCVEVTRRIQHSDRVRHAEPLFAW